MNQQESLEFLQQCINEVKKLDCQKIKKEPNNFLKKLNLENIKSGSQNPSDGYFEFILQMEKQHYKKNIER